MKSQSNITTPKVHKSLTIEFKHINILYHKGHHHSSKGAAYRAEARRLALKMYKELENIEQLRFV